MAGVALRSYGGATLRELGVKLVSRSRANAIARQEADAALEQIRAINPVDTTLMRRSWSVRRAVIDEMIAENTAPYAEWVHYAGERGTLFWETYALPLWEQAQERALARVLDEETRAEDAEYAEEIAAEVAEITPRAPERALTSTMEEAFEVVARRVVLGQPSIVVEAVAEWARRSPGQGAPDVAASAARRATRRVSGRVRL